MGSLTSFDISIHLAGRGRNLFTFRFGVLQVGMGHLDAKMIEF